jgi:D-sedoheptulose 7-phosphate isomerase
MINCRMSDPILQHLDHMIEAHPALEKCRGSVQSAYERIADAFDARGRLYLAGNGGSAADAEHIMGELVKGFESKRPVTGKLRETLGDALADRLQGALPAVSLVSFPALQSAWLNDCDPEYTWAQMLFALGQPGDVFLAISTSGNSRNLAHAVALAKKTGITVIGLTGSHGGKLGEEADVAIHAPHHVTRRIQEYHLPIYHCLCLMLESRFFGNPGS